MMSIWALMGLTQVRCLCSALVMLPEQLNPTQGLEVCEELMPPSTSLQSVAKQLSDEDGGMVGWFGWQKTWVERCRFSPNQCTCRAPYMRTCSFHHPRALSAVRPFKFPIEIQNQFSLVK